MDYIWYLVKLLSKNLPGKMKHFVLVQGAGTPPDALAAGGV